MSEVKDKFYKIYRNNKEHINCGCITCNYITELEQQLSEMQKSIDTLFNSNQNLGSKISELEQQKAELYNFINSLYWDSVLCELLNEETLKEMETLLNKTKNT